ncbi:hypothetical protein SPMU_06500 [Sphingomonas mucosissima]|uniref:WalW protein n=2 Tax=Sphingomonas mucosissima TaxID=370959 RepID=A0A245ZRG6_9SPHN|nr:hypothetical protein SPMU_06500 [Sphingomonas mucosissima]
MTPAGAHYWRMPPPAPTQRIAWPSDFGRRFMIFVDTEEEFDWTAPFSRAARSVTAISALPEMHRRFVDRGVFPCYLCDYPVVADPGAADTLRSLTADGKSAIGAQLHPWVNPPHVEEPSARLSFGGNLPLGLEAQKLDALTDAITKAFGAAPTAFRAGRYGLGPQTLGLLAARGYRVDTSARAYHDYLAQGGPDYRAIGPDAFRTGPADALIEVPLTTIYTGMLRRAGTQWHRIAAALPRGPGLFARAGLLSRVPLTPEGVSIEEACAAVRQAARDDRRLLTFSFHSPSLVPGHTPYVRDAAGAARFRKWWDVMLDLLDRQGFRPITLSELTRAAG